VAFNDSGFTLPVGSILLDNQINDAITVSITDNQNISYSNYSYSFFNDSFDEDDGVEPSEGAYTNIKAVKIRDDISSNIGTMKIGDDTHNVFCMSAEIFKGNVTNIIDENGDAEANFNFNYSGAFANDINNSTEMSFYDVVTSTGLNRENASYYDGSSGTDESSEGDDSLTVVTISSNGLVYSASAVVGDNNTPISLSVDLSF
jgi:hypothetical protein